MPLILILDDRASNRTIYTRLVGIVEPEALVKEFSDPIEALAWLKRNTPDLIITDFRMPKLDGAEFTRRFRALAGASEVPVIVVTAYDEAGYSTDALDAGATEFLRTPLDHSEFVLRVRNVLRMHRQHKELQRRAFSLEQELKASEQVREHLVRDSREALAQVIDTIPAMISAADRDGRCVFSNAFRNAFLSMVADGAETAPLGPFGIEHAQREASLNAMVFRDGATLPAFEEELVANGSRLVLWTTKAPLRDVATNEVVNVLTTSLDITARKVSEERLDYRATHDLQTGLPNRLMLETRLDQAAARGGRGDVLAAMHMIDLDQFKAINDSLGHLCGDEVLRQVAERIRVHAQDNDTVARIGGDEFVVLQTTISSKRDAQAFAGRIVKDLTTPFTVDGRQVTISASIGTALYPLDGSTFTQLLSNADLAMYTVKRTGRNGDAMFVPSMTTTKGWRLQMRDNLRHALVVDQFHLVYQPQVEITSGRIVGVEALLRWRTTNGDIVPPNVFLPIAEEFGMIAAIDALVMVKACDQAARWTKDGVPRIRMCVNISPASFDVSDVPKIVEDALAISGMEPEDLEIELTEQTLAIDTFRAAAALHKLKAHGVKIAIDDFGVGHSSMQVLKEYPIDRLKIDRSFITNVVGNSTDGIMVKAFIELGLKLKMTVIAEGVETIEQLTFLVGEGCNDFQGYYFSRPVAPERIPDMVRQRYAVAG